MYAHELFEAGKPNIVVTYPGRFQPFHQGHAGVFQQLQKQFGRDSVYVLTSNDQSSAKSPFNFSDKYQLITAAGVPGDRIIETNKMYALPEGMDPTNTIFITAVGAPDANRLSPDTFLKKDRKDSAGNIIKQAGSPSYYKTWGGVEEPVTADQHGYVIVIPEIKKNVTLNGQTYDVSHGTECRNLWNQVRNDKKASDEFLKALYGKATPEIRHIFDKIPDPQNEDVEMDSMAEGCDLVFGSVELSENQILPYVKQYFECYNIEQPHIKSVSNIRGLNNTKLSESSELSEVEPFINLIKNLNSPAKIKIGDMFAVLAFEVVYAYKEINAYGFTTPKEVTDIKLHSNGTINYITFADGDRYPRISPATYGNKPVTHPAYFNNKKSAQSALSMLALKVPEEWELELTHLQNLEEDASGYIPKNKKEANDPRWSNALTVDVHPDTLNKNLKAFNLTEFAPDGFDGFEDDNRVPMHFVIEKELYNPRSKWKKSYKPQGGGVALFATKEEAIQAAEKFNRLDKNREFKYGGIQMADADLDEGFDKEAFRQQMRDLEAREELRKTDPVAAKALDLRGQLPQQSKKKPEDDSIGINDPRHPGYAYTQAGQHKLDEFAPDEGSGSRKFIPWPEFIEQLKQILHKDFSCKENIVKSTIKARFVPHDPMEYGPTMLYSYYETRAGGRNKGAVSTRGSIQVGKYYPNTSGLGDRNFITQFSLLKGHPFERHFDLTFDNIYKIANIIQGNTQGAYQMPQQNVAEETTKCPPATQDITLNLKNRQKAINEYGYGPLNPDLPNTKFWMKKVDEWNLDSVDEAKQSLCGNCAAFDQRQDTLDCIAKGIDADNPGDAEATIDAGDLGYCKFLKFKCASRRTCDAWVTGGPLTDKQEIDEDFGDFDQAVKMIKEAAPTINYGIGKNPGKLVKVGKGGKVPHATMHVNVSNATAKKLGLPHNVNESEEGQQPDFPELLKEFLPLAMKNLKLKNLPKINLEKHIKTHDGQATFGRYVNGENVIHLAIADRHPLDILRTLAHELSHYKQDTLKELTTGSGRTGSPEENEAHVMAGIIMRHFNKAHPELIKLNPIEMK